MAHLYEIYPKLVLEQDTWVIVLKIHNIDTQTSQKFVRTVAAGITIPITVPVLKIVVIAEGPDNTPLSVIAAAIRDDVIDTGKTAIAEWIDYAETQFTTVVDVGPTRQDYWDTLPPTATATIRQWLRKAVVDNHSWPIIHWHQHEYDGETLVGGS